MKGNITSRIILIISIVVFAAWFLVPTARWYMLSPEKQELADKDLLSLTVTPDGTAVSNVALFQAEKREADRLKKMKSKILKLGLDLQGGMHIVLQADVEDLNEKEREDTLRRALEIIRNRIDRFGVSEPSISRQGQDRIVVQLPGVKDPKRAEELLSARGTLSFKLVDEELSKQENFQDYENGILKPEVTLPEDREILFVVQKNPDTQQLKRAYPIVLFKNAPVTGASLKSAEIGRGQFGDPQVDFSLKPEAANIFAEFTAANINKQLAIVLDDNVRSHPVIRDKLIDRGTISGSYTMEEALDLALILRAGALPVKLEIVEQRMVGPSLGKDSIETGVKAAWIGIILVFGFMLFYYKLAGFIAVLATIFNLFITIGLLTGLGLSLTLPGIAGLILTVGMAVDANVIINERIKEELRWGKTPVAAIQAGYDRAFITVLDSNLTTMIVAAVLFQFGTGPIKGFAVTLFIGIAMNLFTGVYMTRTLYMMFTQNREIRRLSI